jgi:hypothetical protein
VTIQEGLTCCACHVWTVMRRILQLALAGRNKVFMNICEHVLALVAGSSGSAAPEGPGIPASLRPPLM